MEEPKQIEVSAIDSHAIITIPNRPTYNIDSIMEHIERILRLAEYAREIDMSFHADIWSLPKLDYTYVMPKVEDMKGENNG